MKSILDIVVFNSNNCYVTFQERYFVLRCCSTGIGDEHASLFVVEVFASFVLGLNEFSLLCLALECDSFKVS